MGENFDDQIVDTFAAAQNLATSFLEESQNLQNALECAEECNNLMQKDNSMFNNNEINALNDKIVSIKTLYFKTLNNDAKAFALKFAIKLKEKKILINKLLNNRIVNNDKQFCDLMNQQLNRSAFLLREMVLIANNE